MAKKHKPSFSIVLFVLLLFPVAYVATILDVVVHEVVGHGFVAWALGGRFDGFDIQLDGMGRASAYCESHQEIVLLGGVAAEVFVGGVLLALSNQSAKRRLAYLGVTLTSFVFLINGSSYGFWNTLYPNPPGDLGVVLTGLTDGKFRWAAVVVFGCLLIGSSLLANLFLFRRVESIVGGFTKKQACIVAGLFAVGGLANFAFDWNQLIGGVGRIPQIGGVILQLASCVWLPKLRRPSELVSSVEPIRWIRAAVGSWLVCLSVVLLIDSWLRHGVHW